MDGDVAAGSVRQEIEAIGIPASVLIAVDRPRAFELPATKLGAAGALRVFPRWSGEAALRVGGGEGDTFITLSHAHYVAYSRSPSGGAGPRGRASRAGRAGRVPRGSRGSRAPAGEPGRDPRRSGPCRQRHDRSGHARAARQARLHARAAPGPGGRRSGRELPAGRARRTLRAVRVRRRAAAAAPRRSRPLRDRLPRRRMEHRRQLRRRPRRPRARVGGGVPPGSRLGPRGRDATRGAAPARRPPIRSDGRARLLLEPLGRRVRPGAPAGARAPRGPSPRAARRARAGAHLHDGGRCVPAGGAAARRPSLAPPSRALRARRSRDHAQSDLDRAAPRRRRAPVPAHARAAGPRRLSAAVATKRHTSMPSACGRRG